MSEVSQNEKTVADFSRTSNNSPKSERSWNSAETGSNAVGMRLDPPPGTTCDICLKTFACRSALEIHYRSHTKHRPFKCDRCDKAFTTRGNMKQHILTHKTDDMHWSTADKEPVQAPMPSPPNVELRPQSVDESKKSGGRHQCSICLKHFSSASAVQIHFRTHTGDRPFKCNVCGKAFTTKGNLKVHMGTHMWNGSPTVPSTKSELADGTETKLENPEEVITPVTSPSRINVMNNNSLGWNPFNQNSSIKAPFFGGHGTVVPNYHNMFSSPSGLHPPNPEEHPRPWAWHLTCHICNKELPSPVALETHIKSHLVSDSGNSKPVPAS